MVNLIPYVFIAVVATALVYVFDLLRTRSREARKLLIDRPDDSRLRRREITLRIAAETAFWLAIVAMITFSGSRRGVGTDYELYAGLLERLDPSLPWLTQIQTAAQDPGFVLLSLLSLSVSDSPILVMTLSSILTIVPIAFALRSSRTNLAAAFALVFCSSLFLFPMNIVRQGIAVAINFYSWRFVKTRREYFLLLNLLATCFHLSAGVAAVIQYATRSVRPDRRFYIALGAVAALSTTLVLLPWDRMLEPSTSRYAAYIVSHNGLSSIGIGTLANLVARVAVLVYTGMCPASTPTSDRLQTYLSMSLPFMALGAFIPAVARIELYFLPAVVLLIPDTLKRRAASTKHWAIVALAALGYYAATLISFYGLLPYQTWLSS